MGIRVCILSKVNLRIHHHNTIDLARTTAVCIHTICLYWAVVAMGSQLVVIGVRLLADAYRLSNRYDG